MDPTAGPISGPTAAATSPVSMRSTRPLSVGMLAPPWVPVPPLAYGGTELMVDTLSRGLRSAGHEVHLFTTGDSTCPVDRDSLFARADPDRMGATVLEVRHVAAAYEFFERVGVDVVHDHTIAGVFFDGRPADLPVVTTCHGPFDEDLTDLYRRASHRVGLIAISDDQSTRAPPDVPIAAVIRHGIDLDRYPFSPVAHDHLLFLGRMDRTKGVAVAVRAARAAERKIVIAAKMRNPDEHRYYQTEVAPLLGEDAVFIGEADQATKVDLLRGASALVNPISWPEPFGLVMIEAMACGTPVVGYPGGAAREIVDDGLTGYLVSTETGLVDALQKVEAIDRSACRAAVAKRFSSDRMVAEHVALYRSVIEAGAVIDLRNLEDHVSRQP